MTSGGVVISPNGDIIRSPIVPRFTEEFLQAVSAAQDAANLEPPVPVALDPRNIEAQPEAFQILWDRFTDEQLIATDLRSCRRVESWFLHHYDVTRCPESRISLLSDDFSTWHASLVATWNDSGY